MQVKHRVRGVKEFQDYLKRTVPRGAVKVALAALADWMVGAEDRALRHYEPYKYVHPFRSYSADPKKAARQRGWIFTHLDQIGQNNRTNKTANAWSFKETNNGYGITLENPEEGAKWLWKKQTRQNAAVGHRTLNEKVQSNIAGAIRHAKAAVGAFLKQG